MMKKEVFWDFQTRKNDMISQAAYELACAISIIILFFVLILNFAVKIISKRFSKAWY